MADHDGLINNTSHGQWFLFAFCQPYQMVAETFRAHDLFPNIRTTRYDEELKAVMVQFRRPE